jgi:2-polyprenyl-3-methyl-5-hydroxy-6-metoxy-1,4-benzoquinol methylase
MSYDYDLLYGETPDALGAPTPVFVTFFTDLPLKKQRVLDIGCGQGRDAVFIAKMGHTVTGVDLSPNGICDLNNVAKSQDLPITGIVADITSFEPSGAFDVILIDRTLHMLDADDQSKTLANLLAYVAPRGWVLIADERSNLARFHAVFNADAASWNIMHEKGGTLFLQRAD